jgi:hypothetical protein
MKLFLPVVVLLLGCGSESETDLPTEHAATLNELQATAPPVPITPWLREHFKTPIAPQGAVPEGFEGAEGGIRPEDCSTCHQQQYEDWKQSWHAMGMGPGMMGQLVDLDGKDDHQVSQCNRCHAPLSEQAPRISETQEDGSSIWIDNPDYLESERTKGLTCTGCHVRSHQRYGPGNSPNILAASASIEAGEPVSLVHNGAHIRPEFKSPAFCKTCHDFDQKPRIGVSFEQAANDDAGVLLSQVSSGGAAEEAGLKVGDRIIDINGKAVVTGSDVKEAVESSGAGIELLVRLRRQDDYLSLKMTPRETRARPSGKMLQETTEEWRRTSYAAEGKTCQDCHMPQGRHLWKGIHDPEMVKRGLSVDAVLSGVVAAEGVWASIWGTEQLQAVLTATNTGAGHRLPTYTTPEIHLIMEQLDSNGAAIEGTLQQTTIARRMKPDLSEELYDTRLLPRESHQLRYDQELSGRATSLHARIEVWPDEAYRRNYEIWLKRDKFPTGRDMLESALQASIDSRYVLWTETISL